MRKIIITSYLKRWIKTAWEIAKMLLRFIEFLRSTYVFPLYATVSFEFHFTVSPTRIYVRTNSPILYCGSIVLLLILAIALSGRALLSHTCCKKCKKKLDCWVHAVVVVTRMFQQIVSQPIPHTWKWHEKETSRSRYYEHIKVRDKKRKRINLALLSSGNVDKWKAG